jgi:riboflavin kinase/FMN adenylyltransferase
VYACRARVSDAWYVAAVNLGVNPTFGGDPATSRPKVEAYLVDFEGDLYGQTLRIEFHLRLRDELKFDSAEALIEQMTRDVATTRDVLES